MLELRLLQWGMMFLLDYAFNLCGVFGKLSIEIIIVISLVIHSYLFLGGVFMNFETDESRLEDFMFSDAIRNRGDVLKNLGEIPFIHKGINGADALSSAIYYSGLMYSPFFHSNIDRLEILIHLVLGGGVKKTPPKVKNLRRLYRLINETSFSMTEDPAEDVMVNRVHFRMKTYSILEGQWESNAFYLQLFLDVVSKMPDNQPFKDLKSKIEGLLSISDFLINRSNLEDFTIGSETLQPDIPIDENFSVFAVSRQSLFTKEELKGLGLEEQFLEEFYFPIESREVLINSEIGNSPLEKKPFLKIGEEFSLILPNTIAICIKHLIISFCLGRSIIDILNLNLENQYLLLLSATLRIHFLKEQIRFSPISVDDISIPSVSISLNEIDPGRYLCLVLLHNPIEINSYLSSGINSISEININGLIPKILMTLERVENIEGFKEGKILLISCGWGVNLSSGPIERLENVNWEIEFISAHDFLVLIKTSDMDAIKFWHFIQSYKQVSKLGVKLLNPNGLLSFYAWIKDRDFEVMPHSTMANNNGWSMQPILFIEPSWVLGVRQGIYKTYDEKFVYQPSKYSHFVQRIRTNSLFDEDLFLPMYRSLSAFQNREMVSYIEVDRIFWIEIELDEISNRSFAYSLWEGLSLWLAKFQMRYDYRIENKIINWKVKLNNFKVPSKIEPPGSDYVTLSKVIHTQVIRRTDEAIFIDTQCHNNLMCGFYSETNDAEKAIIGSLFSVLLGLEITEYPVPEILDSLFDDEYAKHCHLFNASKYYDWMRDQIGEPIRLDKITFYMAKNGLAWDVRSKEDSPKIQGKENCTNFLAQVIDVLIDKITKILKLINKEEMITLLLNNIISLDALIDEFERTYKSNIGCHKNKNTAEKIVLSELANLILMKITCRIGIEIANCECRDSGGQTPGEIEVNRISSLIDLLMQYGGLSDEIMYDCAPSSLTISPLGDILSAKDYSENIFMPYAIEMIKNQTSSKVNDYLKEFSIEPLPETIRDIDGHLPSKFAKAWKDEFSFTVEEGFKIVDSIINEGFENNLLIIIDTYDSLVDKIAAFCDRQKVESFLNRFSLQSRNKWSNIPSGYELSDIYPWKFQRRLSLVSKSIVRSGQHLIIAPSLLMDCYKYNLFSFYEARFGARQTTSLEMEKWIGFKSNQIGRDFNQEVAKEFLKFDSMRVYTEVKLPDLLNKKFSNDYGDIDVLVYHETTGFLLVIECKKLHTARNPSEVARQLYDFRGEKRDSGKPDRLLKHIYRVEIINDHLEVAGSIKYKKQMLTINKIIPCMIFSSTVPMHYSNIVKKKGIELIRIDTIEQNLSQYIG